MSSQAIVSNLIPKNIFNLFVCCKNEQKKWTQFFEYATHSEFRYIFYV